MTLTPRHKLIAVGVLTLAVPLLAAAQGASAASAARLLLGLIALGGIVAWVIHSRNALPTSAFKAAPRLQVLQRVGLSQRTQVALVEVDGKPYLIVHGDGFAKIRSAVQPQAVAARTRRAPVATLTGISSGVPS